MMGRVYASHSVRPGGKGGARKPSACACKEVNNSVTSGVKHAPLGQERASLRYTGGKSSAPCNAWGPGADVKIGKLAQASFRCYVLIHALGESSGEVHAGAGRSGATRPTDRGPSATALRAGP